MLKIVKHKKAQSTLEYITVFILIMSVFLLFGYYMRRGISGRWKSSGDMLGGGKIFDASGPITGTFECAYIDGFMGISDTWYSVDCYKKNDCARKCYGFFATEASCSSCVSGCQDSRCE